MEYNLTIIFLTFIIYSFIGWIIEIVVCSLEYKRLVNRGFLFGPYCPIYGGGAIAIIVTLMRYQEDPVVVFVFGMLITASLEYYISYLLEKIFHNKWWDYSHRSDNINGRICIGNMIGFGFGACAIVTVAQPLLMNFFSTIPMHILNIIALILAIIFTIDTIYSIIIAYALRNRIIIAEELKAEKLKKLPSLIEKKFKDKISKLRITNIRYFKAFPLLKTKYSNELDQIKSWIEKRNKKLKKEK